MPTQECKRHSLRTAPCKLAEAVVCNTRHAKIDEARSNQTDSFSNLARDYYGRVNRFVGDELSPHKAIMHQPPAVAVDPDPDYLYLLQIIIIPCEQRVESM